MNLRELAEADLEKTLEAPSTSGSPFTLIDPAGGEYAVTGMAGDIGFLIEPERGEKIRGRSIECSCRIKTLAALTSLVPCRGWKARLIDLRGNAVNVFVSGCDADRTIGIYNLSIALDMGGGA
ncbi:MAG: hypothetical protein LBC88_03440 [Spirochaetaceae bacterium]|nr:hypothetical protein [Spirochaetaceae bacterium]